jgi:hypothetical protein
MNPKASVGLNVEVTLEHEVGEPATHQLDRAGRLELVGTISNVGSN